jgi:hypothetical protein
LAFFWFGRHTVAAFCEVLVASRPPLSFGPFESTDNEFRNNGAIIYSSILAGATQPFGKCRRQSSAHGESVIKYGGSDDNDGGGFSSSRELSLSSL